MKIEQLHVVITGATGGIGEWLAQLLSRRGAHIIAIARNQQRLHELVNKLQPHRQHPHLYFCCDIADRDQRNHLIDALQALQPQPNYLINLAGSGGLHLFEQETTEQIEQTLLTNINATLLLTRQLLPIFRRQTEAGIINVGSIFGSIGYPGYVSYCTSKFAIRGFSEALQRELADSAIGVKYFAPRATKTDFNSAQARALNRALSNREDEPSFVAEELIALLDSHKHQRFLGWPERFFVWLNQVAPMLVGRALRQQLSTIKHYAMTSISRGETP